jgi:hypothetical protein
MIACGKGFVVARPQVPAMVPFLWRQTDTFSCGAIPAGAALGTEDLFQQGSWRYLMLAVGWTWRWFGVSWSALGPLFAVLFGATIGALYAVFRLGTNQLLAATGALLLCFSPMHLRYLLVLRDYTKAPFTLVLMFMIGLLVVRRPSGRSTIAIAAAYGVVLGAGYGFRTDFLGDVPPFFVALFLFLGGGVARNLPLKLAATGVCAAAFALTAWPVLSSLDRSRGGCEWHVVVLGFASSFAGPMDLEPAPYEVNREYLDEFAYTNVTSYAGRVHPGVGHIEYCAPSYGTATKAYLRDVITTFPADVVVRAYASALRIVELPFIAGANEDASLYPPPRVFGVGVGLLLALGAVALAAAIEIRRGLFLAFFIVYFGGLPAAQYDARHFFHLEFMAWWAAAFLLHASVVGIAARVRTGRWSIDPAAWLRSTAVVAGCALALVLGLSAARLYQQAAVRSLVAAYLSAPRETVPLGRSGETVAPQAPVRVSPHSDPETADFVAVDVNASRCGAHATVAFRYEDGARRPFSRVFEVPRDASPGLSHIFMPVYERFGRLEFTDAPAGCIDGVYRVRGATRFPLLLEAMLRPDWRRAPLYQRFRSDRVQAHE